MSRFRNWQGKKDGEWYSRGYLPHRDGVGLIQAITFRLGDSLPQSNLVRLEDELSMLEENLRQSQCEHDYVCHRMTSTRRARVNAWLDAGYGSCLFNRPDLADCVKNVLLAGNDREFELFAWCVMPNHVHVVVRLNAGVELGSVIKAWKSASARKVMTVAGLDKGIWCRDYFDRFIRDADHLAKAIAYAENNPVKAGLTKEPRGWRWSSAWDGV